MTQYKILGEDGDEDTVIETVELDDLRMRFENREESVMEVFESRQKALEGGGRLGPAGPIGEWE